MKKKTFHEKIELPIHVPNKQGELEYKAIKIDIVMLQESEYLPENPYYRKAFSDRYLSETVFKTVLPAYIYDALTSSEALRHIYDKERFSKTISMVSLDSLLERLKGIYTDFVLSLRSAECEKCIFVYTECESKDHTSRYNGAELGISQIIDFKFFVGYRTPSFGSNVRSSYYSRTMEQLRKDHDSLDKYKIIPWTQEREDFLSSIAIGINTIVEKLNSSDLFSNLSSSDLELVLDTHIQDSSNLLEHLGDKIKE